MVQTKNSGKEIIILRHSGGRMGNQLLLYASIYAFCLEYGYRCINYTFYNYRDYFEQKYTDKFIKLVGILSRLKLYNTHRDYFVIYQIYKILTYVYSFFKKGITIKEDLQSIIYLSPTEDANKNHQKLIQNITQSNEKIFYFDGWNFRNPVGLKKYHKEIIKLLKPKQHITDSVNSFIAPLKKEYYLIGVHIRQGEYKSKKFMGGDWYFSEKEVVEILKAYLKKTHKNSSKVKFVLCSDNALDLSYFDELKVERGIGSIMEDLVALSNCDVIIGSNSTFGSFAAYLGNIPFFVLDHQEGWIKGRGDNLFQY